MRRLLVILLCLVQPLWADVAINSQEASGAGHRITPAAGTQTLSWSFNNAAGTFIVVSVTVSCAGGATATVVTAPTYGGQAMSQASTVSFATNSSITRVYTKTTPLTGANNFSFQGSCSGGNTFLGGGAISFTSVDLVTPLGTATTGSGASGTTATAGSITTAAGNMIYAGGSWGSGTGGTAGAGFTRTFLLNGSGLSSGDDILGETRLSAGSSITPTFTWTGSDNWGIIAIPILAAAATGGTVCPSMNMLGVGCQQ